jgi:hypothetical protein
VYVIFASFGTGFELFSHSHQFRKDPARISRITCPRWSFTIGLFQIPWQLVC